MTNKAKITTVIALVAVFGAGFGVYHLLGNKAPREAVKADIATIKTFEQCSDAGYPIVKHYPDQCKTPDGRIFVNDNPPSQTELAKAEQAIQKFMGEPNLELQYTGQKNHPPNLSLPTTI